MKNKVVKIVSLIIMVAVTVGYLYFIRPLVDDELFNYGFSYNILNGLVPYRDFNMIITPLFNYILAFILAIMGKKLIVYHLVIALIIVGVFLISYKLIGKGAFVLYLLMLIFPYIGYNTFSLGLLFCLFYIKGKKNEDIWEPIIISMMFLTKQTLGLMIIPSLIFAKNKKKTFLIYLVSCLGFILFLISTGATAKFFDYCLFGLFDFADKNATGINLFAIAELVIILGLSYYSYKLKDKEIMFCLMFQVVTLPIINYYHFTTSFVPVVYLLFKYFKDKSYFFLFTTTAMILCFGCFNFLLFMMGDRYKTLTYYGKDNFMKGRVVGKFMEPTIDEIAEFIEKYADYDVYYFGFLAYLAKLNLDIPINKYDLINNGNMGYKGKDKYIKEVDSNCQKNKCLIFINDYIGKNSDTLQVNKDILEYVKNNYTSICSSNVYNVYINR